MGGQADGSAGADGNVKRKGKEVATVEDGDHELSARQPNDDSLLSKVGQSAAVLSKSLFSGHTAATESLTSVSSTAKSGPSSTKDSHAGETSVARRQPDVGAASVFRSGQTDAHIAAEEAAFSEFLSDTSVFVPTEPVGLQTPWSTQTVGPAEHSVPAQRALHEPSSVEEQQLRDGQDVVNLLANYNEEVLDFDGGVTITESELPKLRAALFGGDAATHQSEAEWDNVLNFIPDFLRTPNDGSHGITPSHEVTIALGVSDPVDAGHIWLEQWHRVLTSYTDEVWGDLGALVQEAREEVKQLEEAKPGQPPPETKALQRLRQILAHLRG